MNERIKFILAHYNLSARKFAEKLGIQASGISHILSGRNKPGYDFIVNVLNTFPEINPDWFILGNGDFSRKTVHLQNVHNKAITEDIKNSSAMVIKKDVFCEPEPATESRIREQSVTYSANNIHAGETSQFNAENINNDTSHRYNVANDNMASSNNSKNVDKIIILHGDKTFSIYNQE